jgi:hypothetical protein
LEKDASWFSWVVAATVRMLLEVLLAGVFRRGVDGVAVVVVGGGALALDDVDAVVVKSGSSGVADFSRMKSGSTKTTIS